MIARLLGDELRNRGQHTIRVASEHDDVLRGAGNVARYPSIGNKLDRVRAACVLGDGDIVVVWLAICYVEDDVLEDRAEANGIVDLGLLFGGEVDALGVAPAFDVEDTRIGPYVLVVADELSSWVGREGSLAGTGETKEEGDVAPFLVDVGRGVERKLAEFDGHEVVHDGEDTLFHLSSVLGTEDNHLHALEVDLDGGGRGHTGSETVGRELAGIVNNKVGLAKLLELVLGGTDEHVVHEEGVVGSCANDSDLDAVLGVPLVIDRAEWVVVMDQGVIGLTPAKPSKT